MTIRESLLQQGSLYRADFIVIHLFNQIISLEQYRASGGYAFLTRALQASIDAMRCPLIETDLHNILYHDFVKAWFNFIISAVTTRAANEVISYLPPDLRAKIRK
jgi:hypothetical protein